MRLGQGIAFKQAKIILLTAFLLGGLSALVQLSVDLKVVREGFLSDIERSVHVYVPSLKKSIYNLDTIDAHAIATALIKDPLFISVGVYDDFGDRMVTIHRPTIGATTVLHRVAYQLLDIPKVFTYPIQIRSANHESAARLVLGLDTGYMSHDLVQRALTLLLLGLITTLVLCSVLFMVLYRALSKPIQRIARWVEQLDQSNETESLPYNKHDELGLLTRNVAEIWHKKHMANQQVENLAYYDSLTELVNRRMFIERLDETLLQLEKENSVGVVMYLDVDRFKTINDSLGHGIGDKLLVIIAQRLRQILCENITIARFGGDEFVVLAPDLGTDVEQATLKAVGLAQALVESITQPIKIERNLIHCSTSIGLTTFPQPHDSSSSILRRADTALYSVKDAGRNGFKFYDDSMQQQVQERWQLEEGLHKAGLNGELEIWLQPQVCARNFISGAEVLLRWRHPTKGMIPPDEFISVAEESGQIHAIEEWVLETALRYLKSWSNVGLPNTFKHFAVNISPAHFMQADFISRMLPIIQRYDIPNVTLEFEITENLLINNFEQASSTMQMLQQHNVSLAIDDFGTGYSSLRYLNQLPLNMLKIDRSFIQRMEDSDEELAIVDIILMTANKLGLEVIAEGVETAHQRSLLAARGCQLYQGFYFSKPVYHSEFYELLTEHDGRMRLTE